MWRYVLEIDNRAVTKEELFRGNQTMINRATGEIFSSSEDKYVAFKIPENQIALKGKLDLIQAPYLEAFNTWANAVFHFHFGTSLGQNTVSNPVSLGVSSVNFKDENATTQIYAHAYSLFGDPFDHALIEDMRAIGYDITNVEAKPLNLQPQLPQQLIGLSVDETGVGQPVEQHMMSTGMFRALAILIHLNLGVFSQHAEMILLDDIGEGLDFERSKALIDVIVKKVRNSNIQIVMTSNDRFIMNSVSIDYWTVLSREGFKVSARNKFNSEDSFDEFKYSGLQNFDFFSMDLAKKTDSDG